MVGNCYFITSGLCWKTTAIFANSNLASGKCESCLAAMRTFGYHANHIGIMANGTELASGARVQFIL